VKNKSEKKNKVVLDAESAMAPKADDHAVVEGKLEHNLESRSKTKTKVDKPKPESAGQVKIFVKDEVPPANITAAKFCAGLPVKPDQAFGFLAESKLKYGENDTATVDEWAKRHEAFKKRPIK